MADDTVNTVSARSKGQTRRFQTAIVNTDHTCNGCGVIFRPKRSDRVKYCSRECAFRNAESWHPPKRSRLKSNVRPCDKCGTVVLRPRIRCDACKATPSGVAYVSRKIHKQCLECASPIFGGAHKVRCKRCSKKKAIENSRRLHGKVKKHRHRARKYGVYYEPINPIAVFDRDSWKCQVCFVTTPSRLRGTNHPTAPELDHRIPMSKGGPHSWGNVQCCCRKCNTAKGSDLVLGQQNMFPIHK